MFEARWSFGKENFSRVRDMRLQCFVNKQGISAKEEFDKFDGISAHLFVEDETGAPIATGRIFPHGEETRIGRIAVAEGYEGKGYGDLVLRMLLYKAEALMGAAVATEPRLEDARLFEPFGFIAQGEPFFKRSAMRVLMRVQRDAILWPSQCKD